MLWSYKGGSWLYKLCCFSENCLARNILQLFFAGTDTTGMGTGEEKKSGSEDIRRP